MGAGSGGLFKSQSRHDGQAHRAWATRARVLCSAAVLLLVYCLYLRHVAHQLTRLNSSTAAAQSDTPSKVPVGKPSKTRKGDRAARRKEAGLASPEFNPPRVPSAAKSAAPESEPSPEVGVLGVPEAECAEVATLTKSAVLASGRVMEMRQLNITRRQFIAQYDRYIRYTHMATVERVRNDVADHKLVAAAWQAAPAARFLHSAPVRMAVEGLPDQRIWASWSRDLGATWDKPAKVPMQAKAAVWGPVLHCDARGALWLFYAESTECIRPMTPPTWEPGGDIKAVLLRDPELGRWSAPRTLLRQNIDGVPKVIANKLVVLSTGEWVLPFWRERPTGATCPNLGTSKSQETRTTVGLLVSSNQGEQWRAVGRLASNFTMLLEPAVVELIPTKQQPRAGLMLLLRSDAGCVFKSVSYNLGKSWTTAEPINVPNPNTKFHALRLKHGVLGNKAIALVYNNHKRTQNCRACRTHLHLAVSLDEGNTWKDVAIIEDELEAGVRIHYPTLQQIGRRLLVAYSRFYLGRDLGMGSTQQGIRLVEVNLNGVEDLPQLQNQKLANRTDYANGALMRKIVDHFLSAQSEASLRRYRDQKWHSLVSAIADHYDLDGMGSDVVDRLRKQKKLAQYSSDRVRQLLPPTGDGDFLASMQLASSQLKPDATDQQGSEDMVSPRKRELETDIQVQLPEIEECASLPCCVDFGKTCINMPECVDGGCASTPCCPTEDVEDP